MSQFDEKQNGCSVCEAMLPEAVDGTLSAVEQQAFDRHVAGCTRCAQELAEARRGAAWLSMLKSRAPEPPAGLLERILAETSGAEAAVSFHAASPGYEEAAFAQVGRSRKPTGGWSTRWAAARMKLGEVFSLEGAGSILQPRLAMTAGMAFFSLALTLNLMGVRVRDLRAANFGPSGVRRTVADASASATRQFENLRLVYQVESRVAELRSDEMR